MEYLDIFYSIKEWEWLLHLSGFINVALFYKNICLPGAAAECRHSVHVPFTCGSDLDSNLDSGPACMGPGLDSHVRVGRFLN